MGMLPRRGFLRRFLQRCWHYVVYERNPLLPVRLLHALMSFVLFLTLSNRCITFATQMGYIGLMTTCITFLVREAWHETPNAFVQAHYKYIRSFAMSSC